MVTVVDRPGIAALVIGTTSNRARYNAEKVVAAFSGRLRRTLDLATMQDDLVSAVQLAFQPVHISVWLPPGSRR